MITNKIYRDLTFLGQIYIFLAKGKLAIERNYFLVND